MRKPSVIFINRVYPPGRGATGRMLRDLARSFAREGWQVTVITTGPEALKERDGGVQVIRLRGSDKPMGVIGYARTWLKMLVLALRLPKTDLVVTMSDPPLLVIVGQIVKYFKNARHINWCHDLYPDILPALGLKLPSSLMGRAKDVARRAMRNADKVIVIGRCMAQHLTSSGIEPGHISMIPNWPDTELSGTKSKAVVKSLSHAELHQMSGSKPYEQQLKDKPKFRVLYAGNIGLAHPLETILGAAEILNAEHPEVEFVFVGDGARFQEIERERSRLRLDNIRLMPYQPPSRLQEMMESGDVHLISVKNEAAGMLVPCKLYSALAVQRPCIFIGPKECEAAQVITDFKAGVVVAQGQAEKLAACIRNFRLNGDDWFAAHHGAAAAGAIFLPKESINAWIERAWMVVEKDIGQQRGFKKAV